MKKWQERAVLHSSELFTICNDNSNFEKLRIDWSGGAVFLYVLNCYLKHNLLQSSAACCSWPKCTCLVLQLFSHYNKVSHQAHNMTKITKVKARLCGSYISNIVIFWPLCLYWQISWRCDRKQDEREGEWHAAKGPRPGAKPGATAARTKPLYMGHPLYQLS